MIFSFDSLWPYLEITLSIIITLIGTWVAAKTVQRVLTHAFKYYAGKNQASQYNFFIYLITGIIYFIGAFSAISMIPHLRNLAYSVLASSSILALVAGLASQQAFSQIISGFFLQFFKTFEIGDYIKIGKDTQGIVKDITLKYTVLIGENDKKILVPNSIVNTSIIENINSTKA